MELLLMEKNTAVKTRDMNTVIIQCHAIHFYVIHNLSTTFGITVINSYVNIAAKVMLPLKTTDT